MYYNQLILTFGTHYVSSIVVGGIVRMYTQISSAYQQAYSKQSIEDEISIGFEFEYFGLSLSPGSGVEVAVNTEEFLKNTKKDIKFLPAVITTPETEKRKWDIWLEQTSDTPVVVNRTLLPLTDLLIEYPAEIRRHLQLTTDYYLKNGKVPTLEQLSNGGKRKKRTITSANILPGVDVVGCGYDILSLRSKSCLLDITMNDNTTWSDVFDSFKTYQVPDGFFVINNRDLLSMSDLVFFDSMKQFISESYISNQEDSFGFLGFGASHDREEIKTRYEMFYQYKYRMAWRKQQVIWFTLGAATFPSPRFNRIAALSIDRLPTTFSLNETQYEKFRSFFDAYGTHIVVQADIGGMLWGENYFEECLVRKKTEQWIRRELYKFYWFFYTEKDISETYHKTVEEDYRKNSLSFSKIIGGFTLVTPLTGYNWLPTIKSNPAAVTYRLQPIYTLLPRGNQREALKEATYYFRSVAVNKSNLYIQRLESETTSPLLPQLNCTISH